MRSLLIFVAVLAGLVTLSCGASRKKRQSYWRTRSCEKQCETEPYQPTCGYDGQTYVSPCACHCVGQPACYPGACSHRRSGARALSIYPDHHVSQKCIDKCDGEWFYPVCGLDGLDYDNRCHAQCMGVHGFMDGYCPI